MPWLSDNRINKKTVREIVFSCGPKKSVLLLPGYRCECVIKAIENNVINEETVCTFVEKDLETVCQIRQWIEDEWRMPIPPIVHHGKLNDLELVPIDMAYVDLFGNLTKSDFEWIKNQLIPNVMPNCDLFFTFSFPVRSNEFIKSAICTLKNKYPELLELKVKKLKNVSENVKQIIAVYEVLFDKAFKGHDYETEYLDYRDGKTFTMILMAIKKIKIRPDFLLKKLSLKTY